MYKEAACNSYQLHAAIDFRTLRDLVPESFVDLSP